MPELVIAHGATEDLLSDALDVRRRVFIEGQGVPEARELDGLDQDEGTEHYVGYLEDEPVAVARTRRIYIQTATMRSHDVKIERVGVLPEHRGRGFGRQTMEFIIDRLNSQSRVREAILESQTHALDFYRDLGFITIGRVFDDAGIPHKKMYLPINR